MIGRGSILLSTILVAVGAGCGGPGLPAGVAGPEDDHPQFGEPVPVTIRYRDDPPQAPAPPPLLTILEPRRETTARLRTGDRISCRVRIAIPDGGRLPSQGFIVELRNTAGAVQDSCSPRLVERPGESLYLFACELKSPRRPGRYTIRASATDTVTVVDRPGADIGIGTRSIENRVSRFHSEPVMVEVVR